jgi:hypothetical protein
MQTMEQSLADLALRRVITLEAAFARTNRAEQLATLLESGGLTSYELAAYSKNGHAIATETRVYT